MVTERVRDSEEEIDGVESQFDKSLNLVPISDSDAARNTVMSRFNAGESIIQPPGESAPSLGDAIRSQLDDLE